MSHFENVDFFTDLALVDDPYPYFEYLRSIGPVCRLRAHLPLARNETTAHRIHARRTLDQLIDEHAGNEQAQLIMDKHGDRIGIEFISVLGMPPPALCSGR